MKINKLLGRNYKKGGSGGGGKEKTGAPAEVNTVISFS